VLLDLDECSDNDRERSATENAGKPGLVHVNGISGRGKRTENEDKGEDFTDDRVQPKPSLVSVFLLPPVLAPP